MPTTSKGGARPFSRILIPFDASPASARALEVGVEMASLLGSRVTGLYVMDSSAFGTFPGDLERDSIKGLLAKEADEALERVRATCVEHGVPGDAVLREGHPGQVIIELSAAMDLIVMATHGRSGLEHLLLGSVTEKVIRHAKCPVLVVRAPD